jgi:hypothetical protein
VGRGLRGIKLNHLNSFKLKSLELVLSGLGDCGDDVFILFVVDGLLEGLVHISKSLATALADLKCALIEHLHLFAEGTAGLPVLRDDCMGGFEALPVDEVAAV